MDLPCFARLWSMTSTPSWWKTPVWACVLRYTGPSNRVTSSWTRRTRRAWRSLVSSAAATFTLPYFPFCGLLCYCFILSPEIVDQPGVDIFGQVYNQWKNKECECPNCKRLIAASRFAPHLEKCLGMGRNSSRIANRRSVRGRQWGVVVVQIQNKYEHPIRLSSLLC